MALEEVNADRRKLHFLRGQQRAYISTRHKMSVPTVTLQCPRKQPPAGPDMSASQISGVVTPPQFAGLAAL